MEKSSERSSALPYTSVLQLMKREPLDRPRLRSPILLFFIVFTVESDSML